MKKIIAILMLAVMLVSALASCGGNGGTVTTDGNESTTTAPNVGDDTTAAPDTTEPGELLEIPDDTYDGYVFRIVSCGNLSKAKDANDFGGTEEDTELLEVKKYLRKITVEELLDITIEDENKVKFGSCNGSGTGFQTMQKSYSAGSYDYDFAMIGTYDVAQCAYNGFLSNLHEFENIDLTKSWWDRKIMEQSTFGENLFFATGDIGILDNMITHCIMFNKDLVKENADLSDPYEMVRNNTWTFDTFFAETLKFGGDLNGDDKLDENDAYGLMLWNDSAYSMLAATKSRVATLNDGLLELTLYNDKTVTMFDKYVDVLGSSTSFNYQSGYGSSVWDTMRVAMFDNDQVLYSLTSLYTVPKHRDSDTDFGILPHPRLDEQQEGYSVCVGVQSGMYACIPAFYEDGDRTGAIVEALAYHGQKILTPAYYEATLQGTYIRDEESGEMLDIMFANRFFDIGLVFKIGGLNSVVMDPVKTKANNFTSLYNRNKRKSENDITKYNETLSALYTKE
ncbi:MAG: extracellular solute-binding protein [Clostridia bacterium]|nr:extracellular solute-binding protein [Clostridia bacterium]